MAYTPSIDTLRGNFSSFAARGAEPSFRFSQRFGGFQGSLDVARQFGGEPDDAIRRAVPDFRSFANKLNRRDDEPIEPTTNPTFTSNSFAELETKSEPTTSTVPQDFLDNLTASKSYIERTESDDGLLNAAATLRSTEDTAATLAQNPSFSPAQIQAILDRARNASGFTRITSGLRQPNLDRSLIAPFLGQEIIERIDDGERSIITEPQPTLLPEPVPAPEPALLPEPVPAPEPVALPQPFIPFVPPAPAVRPEPTFTRASRRSSMDDEEEIESIDVIGRRNAGGDEEIESIDIIGKGRRGVGGDGQIESIDVQGSRLYDRPDNPYERFKALYADFYTGGRGAETLKEFNRLEDSGEIDKIALNSKRLRPVSDENLMRSDTNAIINAKNEKDSLINETPFYERNSDMGRGTTVINNNSTQMLAPNSSDGSKTSRVFSDDSTFNRHAAADLFHPNYGP